MLLLYVFFSCCLSANFAIPRFLPRKLDSPSLLALSFLPFDELHKFLFLYISLSLHFIVCAIFFLFSLTFCNLSTIFLSSYCHFFDVSLASLKLLRQYYDEIDDHFQRKGRHPAAHSRSQNRHSTAHSGSSTHSATHSSLPHRHSATHSDSPLTHDPFPSCRHSQFRCQDGGCVGKLSYESFKIGTHAI